VTSGTLVISSSQVQSSLLTKLHLIVVHGLEIVLPAFNKVSAKSSLSTLHWQLHGGFGVVVGEETTVVVVPVVAEVVVPVVLVPIVVVSGQQT
jgi:hypothetical protein